MSDPLDPSAAAEQARRRLHEEIERVRLGVEQMLSGGEGDGDDAWHRVAQLEQRLSRLEGRLDQVEWDRRHAEWRMYTNVERLLDGLLRELRAVADGLART